jgi:two-component system sensor histidine kinase PilS (NtrC family)
MYEANKQQSKTDYQLNRSWGHLRLLNYYRGFLALLFLTLFMNGWTELLIPRQYYNPVLFYWTTVVYAFLCITFMAVIPSRIPGLTIQASTQLCIDVFIMIAYIHASGGVRSGLGMLLIVTVSASSLFLPRILTLLFAAFTSLAILAEQLYSQYALLNYEPAYTQAGILGILFFAFAFFTNSTYTKITKSEEFASQQSLELETVVQMNEHIIQSMRTGIMVVSPSGKIFMANQAATNLLGDAIINRYSTIKKVLPALDLAFTNWKKTRVNHKQL